MIQRIQSIYLLLLIICSLLGLFLLPPDVLSGRSFPTEILLKIYLLVSVILSVLSLFSFKYRKSQLVINGTQLLVQSLILLVFIYVLVIEKSTSDDLLLWLSMPLQAIIFLILASRAIRRDEALVRSIDRLR
ncbi:MAG: DUF4293 family protein [Flavobacteriaceae bacterium]|jgi:hypothetical protein